MKGLERSWKTPFIQQHAAQTILQEKAKTNVTTNNHQSFESATSEVKVNVHLRFLSRDHELHWHVGTIFALKLHTRTCALASEDKKKVKNNSEINVAACDYTTGQ